MYAIKMTPNYYNDPCRPHPPSLLTDEGGAVQTYATLAEAQAEAERIEAQVYGARYYLSDGEYARPEYAAVEYHIMQRKGGSVTSEAKSVAVRENGKRGGRPPKPAAE